MADRTPLWLTDESTFRISWLDSGAGNAYILLYGTTKPSIAGDAPGGSPLIRIDLAEPCGIVLPDGSIQLVLGPPTVGLAIGVANWGRLFNGNDQGGLDMTVSTMSGVGEIRLSNRNIGVGTSIKILISTLK